tara:strand:+ start:876 stop:1073 length:198 start_codon:yes stop_codon:yes gene_type:complete
MIKVGDKVYHWQEMNKVGVVVEILRDKNNQMTVGGTTDVRVYYKVQYLNEQTVIHRSGDIHKYYD